MILTITTLSTNRSHTRGSEKRWNLPPRTASTEHHTTPPHLNTFVSIPSPSARPSRGSVPGVLGQSSQNVTVPGSPQFPGRLSSRFVSVPGSSHVALVDDNLKNRWPRRQGIQFSVVPVEAILHLRVRHGLPQLSDLSQQVDVHGDAVAVLAELLQMVCQRAGQTLQRTHRRRCQKTGLRTDSEEDHTDVGRRCQKTGLTGHCRYS